MNRPRLPAYTADRRHQLGTRHRCVASPEDCPRCRSGGRERHRESANDRRPSAPAGRESSHGWWAIALGGCQLPVCTTFLEGVAIDQRWGSHATSGVGPMRRSVMKPYVSRWVPVPSGTEPPRTSTSASPMRDQGPVPGTISRSRWGSPGPRDHEAGARGGGRPNCLGGRQLLTVPPRASPGPARGRRRL